MCFGLSPRIGGIAQLTKWKSLFPRGWSDGNRAALNGDHDGLYPCRYAHFLLCPLDMGSGRPRTDGEYLTDLPIALAHRRPFQTLAFARTEAGPFRAAVFFWAKSADVGVGVNRCKVKLGGARVQSSVSSPAIVTTAEPLRMPVIGTTKPALRP